MATIKDTILTELKLLGNRAYVAGMNAAAASADRLAAAEARVDAAAHKMGGSMNQAVFNVGNLMQMAGRATLALGALATAGAYVGIKFEASMEQSQVAFGELLHSQELAREMLNDLFDLAAKTPFEFPQITDAAQKLLGFGMAADDVLPLLTKVGDAVAAVGADPERIDRITRALGQMQAKGKVYSEELLQLADAGLPAYQMLMKGLGLSGDELNKQLRKGAIDAKTGLTILSQQMDKMYSGMAAKQAKTFNGLLSTLKDYSRMILGFAVRPLFDYLEKKVLPALVKIETSIVSWGRSGGFKRFQRNLQQGFQEGATGKKGLYTPDKQLTIAQKAGKLIGKIWKGVSGYFKDLMNALAPAKPFWDNVLGPFLKGFVVGAFGGFIAILKLAIPIIKIVARVLGWLGDKLEPLSKVFYWLGFAVGFIFGPGKIFSWVTKALGAVGRVIGLVIKPFLWLFKLLMKIASPVKNVAGALLNKLVPAGSRAEDIALRIWTVWDDLSKNFNSIGGLIRAAIPGIAAAFGMLGKAIVEELWKGLKSKGAGPLKVLMGLMPGGAAIAGVGGAIIGAHGGGNEKPKGPQIPSGGSPYGGRAEAGPDTRGAAFRSPSLAGAINLNNYTILDGKVVAKSVSKVTEDKMARR